MFWGPFHPCCAHASHDSVMHSTHDVYGVGVQVRPSELSSLDFKNMIGGEFVLSEGVVGVTQRV